MAPLEKVILGTAQWGLNYGISNSKGITAKSEIKAIIELAKANGCCAYDTASVYGESEIIIGELTDEKSEIITKLPKLSRCFEENTTVVETELFSSLNRLKRNKISAILLHDATDLLEENAKKIFRCLERIKENGYADKIGVSVYTFDEAVRVSDEFSVDLIQLPFNMLNSNLINALALEKLRARGVEVHARSVFLQGLLLMNPKNLPKKLKPFEHYICLLNRLATEQNVSVAQYLMRFPLHRNLVDKVVIGFTDLNELREQTCITYELDYSQSNKLEFPDNELLDPRNW